MSLPRVIRLAATAFLCAVLLAGCGTGSWRKGGVPGSRPYTVRGKTYYPLKSARGFVEEGMASWYGPGFHGKKTANGETYNQFAMTAAHKLLPLGAKVRVTHLGNGRSIIVRVNDRGPFVDDRVIDLSRAAAGQLDMVGAGTARVRIRSLDAAEREPEASASPSSPAASAALPGPSGAFYVQVGAFADKANAGRLIAILTRSGHKGRLLFGGNNMWNVQVGPWSDIRGAQENLDAFRPLYPGAFVVGDE